MLTKQRHILLLIFLLVISVFAAAQTDIKSQDELKKKADEYFKTEDYSSAMPLYSQLVSLYTKDPFYNYRFGICAFYADRRDTEKPLKYLQFASTKAETDVDVFYYLGLVYHQNYRFAEAIEQFEIYKNKASRSFAKLDVDRQIQVCKNAQSMLTRVKDIYVLEKTEVAKKDVFRSYNVERFGGKILVKPDIFKTSFDKKKEKFSLIFIASGNKEAYFSSYGKNGKNGKDIYKSIKKMNGTWSEPINLGSVINSKYDEDFPFLLGDGATLYFSSKGRNTIGGYDIFTSTINDDGIWSTPENLNYPINSPMDDIMFVPDSSDKYAYFSSNRSSIEGLMTFYKVRIDLRKEVDETLVLGSKNDTAYSQSVVYLKEKGNLDVNATEKMFTNIQTFDSANNEAVTKTNETDFNDFVIPENISNEDIVKMAEKQENSALTELQELKKQRETAKIVSQNRKTQSDNKYKEAQQIIKSANSLKDKNQKETELQKASKLKSEAEQLNKESEIALQISEQLSDQMPQKQKDADNAVYYSKEIKKAIQAENTDSSLAILNRMVDILQVSDNDSLEISAINQTNSFIKKKQSESEKIKKDAGEIVSEVALLKEDAETYRENASNTKKKSIKEEMLKKAEETESEANLKQQEVDVLLQKSEKLLAEADSAQAQSDMYVEVAGAIVKNKTVSSVLSSDTSVFVQKNNTAISNSNKLSTQNNTLSQNKTTTTTQNTSDNNAISATQKDTTSQKTNVLENNQVNTLTSEQQELNTNIQTSVDAIQKNIDNESKDLRKQSNAAYNLAKSKYDQSVNLRKDAEEILSESKIAPTDAKKQELLSKFEKLEEESVIAAQQAITANEIAKVLDEAASKRENSSNTVSALAIKISELLKNNEPKIADSLVKEIESTYSDKITASEKTTKYILELSNTMNSKEYETEKALENYQSLQKEADKLKITVNKTNYLAVKKQADSAKAVSDKLAEEIYELKLKVQYSSVLISESPKYSNTEVSGKTDFQNSIEALKTQNVFAQVEDNIQNTKENISVQNNKAIQPISEINDTSRIAVAPPEKTFNENEINQIKTIYIEKTISAVKTEIARVEDILKNSSDTLGHASLQKTLAGLQKKLVELTKEAQITSVTMENQFVVSSRVKITAFALSELIEQQADSLKKLAIDARIDASKTKDANQKEQLLLKAEGLESAARKKEIEAINVQSFDNIVTYYSNKEKIETTQKISDSIGGNKTAELLNNESKYYFDKAQSIREKAENNPSVIQQKTQLQYALNNEKTAIAKQEAAMELYKVSKTQLVDNTQKTNVLNIQNVQNFNQNVLNQNTENKTVTSENLNPVTIDTLKNVAINVNNKLQNNSVSNISESSNTLNNNSTITGTKITENFTGITLDTANTLAVSSDVSGLVPLNPLLPDGIIFKVQIAAVKNHVKSEIFKGITPLTGESTATGLIRYMAGLFAKFEDANTAKTTIRTMGYNDAFIVAYYNGKRISVGEAIAMMKSDNSLQKSYSDINKTEYVSSGADIQTKSDLIVGNAPAKPLANPINNVSGLFYSVQVGVYVRPVTSAQLYNITPLYDEIMPNGMYRYISGIFSDLQTAVSAKNDIIVKGVKDAFVVVYYNGKKITMAEAKQLAASVVTPITQSSEQSETSANSFLKTGSTKLDSVNTTIQNEIVFKVQIGAYKNDVPVAIVNNLLYIVKGNVLEHFTNTAGLTIYTSGMFDTYAKADSFKAQIVAKGITDAFVIAYQGCQKIPVAKAIDLLKK